MHAFEALYTAHRPTPFASSPRPGPAEVLQRETNKHRRHQREPLAEEKPPSLLQASDRLSSVGSVKEASIDIWENISATELRSQESLAASGDSTSLLPEAELTPQVLLGPPIQSTALAPDAALFPQVSLALSSPSPIPVAPAIAGLSSPLAAVTISSNSKLGDYFSPTKYPRTKFTDDQCQDISRLISEIGKVGWSSLPRLYIILRTIDQLQVLDAFIDEGINDFCLPLTISSLPRALGVAYHQEFLETQPLVLSKALDLEKNTKGHVYFTGDDHFPFEAKGNLGEGGFGSVDRILSSLSGREFARKRFRRRDLRKTGLESFMNEVKILKRLYHIHCVELVSISFNRKRLVTARGSLEILTLE